MEPLAGAPSATVRVEKNRPPDKQDIEAPLAESAPDFQNASADSPKPRVAHYLSLFRHAWLLLFAKRSVRAHVFLMLNSAAADTLAR